MRKPLYVWPDDATDAQLFELAMEITDQEEADRYLAALVTYQMRKFGSSREEAERDMRRNLGYHAGYFSDEARARVERLFRTVHPYLGAIAEKGPASPEECLKIGYLLGLAAEMGLPTEEVPDWFALLRLVRKRMDRAEAALKHLYHGVFVIGVDELSIDQYRELEEQTRAAMKRPAAAKPGTT
jgi:hypothetical protein